MDGMEIIGEVRWVTKITQAVAALWNVAVARAVGQCSCGTLHCVMLENRY